VGQRRSSSVPHQRETVLLNRERNRDSPHPEGSGDALRLPGRPTRGRFQSVASVRSAMGARASFRGARSAALPGLPTLPFLRLWRLTLPWKVLCDETRANPRKGGWLLTPSPICGEWERGRVVSIG